MVAIFLFHAAEFSRWLGVGIGGRFVEAAGPEALICFFAISGFLMYRPFVAARAQGRPVPSLTRYARRRALRIAPTYWALLTLLAVFPGVVGVFTPDWWKYYGYLQAYSRRTLAGGIAPAWTLCIDLAFYVALPVWAVLIRRLSPRRLLTSELVPLAVLAVGGAAVGVLAARQQIGYLVGISIAGQAPWIAIGMAFAATSAATSPQHGIGRILAAAGRRSGLCWIGAGLMLVVLMALVPKGGLVALITSVESRQPGWRALVKTLAGCICLTLLFLPLVFGGERQGLPGRLLAWRPIVWLGVIAYSFYLLHLTIIEFIAQRHSPGNFSATGFGLETHQSFLRSMVLLIAGFAATWVLAGASYKFIELPFLRHKEPRRRR